MLAVRKPAVSNQLFVDTKVLALHLECGALKKDCHRKSGNPSLIGLRRYRLWHSQHVEHAIACVTIPNLDNCATHRLARFSLGHADFHWPSRMQAYCDATR